jgi:heme oxygenase
MTQTTPEPVADTDLSLSARLRDETAEVHEAAERSAFVEALLGGALDVREYARFVVQLRAVYEALEDEVAASTDATLAPLLAPELVRLPALTRDLEHLVGPGWAAELAVLPAATAYADRIRLVARTEHEMLLAHHYVRYLGDLSGGQLIGRVLRRVYGLPDTRGTEVYEFDAIPSAKAFKDRYRVLLDALPWDSVVRTRLVDEARVAYRLNTDLFTELMATLPRQP